MENLKVIKDRIGTVESIIKATNAMKMVSTIKLAHINNINKFSKDCYEKLFEMLSMVVGNMKFEQKLEDSSWLVQKKDGRPLILIISTNQGFCGSFNQSIMEQARKSLSSDDNPIIKIFGRKAAGLSPSSLVEIQDRFDIQKFSEKVCEIVINYLKNDIISKVVVVSGHFKNALVQKAETVQIFPFKIEETPKYVKVEGDEMLLAESLFEAYIKKLFNAIITEHIMSELSARTMAMDNSVRNAKDMFKSLIMMYNRSRQAKITQELIEIISSIECVQQ